MLYGRDREALVVLSRDAATSGTAAAGGRADTFKTKKKKPTRWLLQIFGVPAWSWECAEARIKSPIHPFGSDWVMGLRGDKSETQPSVAIFLNSSVRAERTPKTSFSSW